MSGFENVIYQVGAYTFAIGCTAAAFWLLNRIERPRRRVRR